MHHAADSPAVRGYPSEQALAVDSRRHRDEFEPAQEHRWSSGWDHCRRSESERRQQL